MAVRMYVCMYVQGIPFQLMSFPEDVHPCAAEIKKALDEEGIDLPPLNRMVLDGIQGVRSASRRAAAREEGTD